MANKNNTPTADDPQVVEWVEQPLLQRAKVTSDGRILKGIDAEEAPFGSIETWLLCLHSVDLPIPSDDPAVIAQQCVRNVPHPLLGSTKQFAVSMDAALVMLETAHALKKRDDRIADLKARVETMESEHELAEQVLKDRLDEVEGLLRRLEGQLPIPASAPVPAAAPVPAPEPEPDGDSEA